MAATRFRGSICRSISALTSVVASSGVASSDRNGILILDAKRYRYQAFISDISGQDIHTHSNVPDNLIRRVRDWLRVNSGRASLPGQRHIARSFRAFTESLPENCRQNGLDRRNLLFIDYVWLARIWVEAETGVAK